MYEIKNTKYNDPIKYNHPTDTSVNYINKNLLASVDLYFKIKNSDIPDPLTEAKYLIQCFKSCKYLSKYVYIDTLASAADFNEINFEKFINKFEEKYYIFSFLNELIKDVNIDDLDKHKDLYIEYNGNNKVNFNFIRYDETFNNIDGTNLITSDGNIIYVDESIILHLHKALLNTKIEIQKSVIYSREKGLI